MSSLPRTLALVGATGKVGRHVVRQALRTGFHVRALARDPSRVETLGGRIEVIRGDVRELPAVRVLVAGAAAVVSTLGQRRGEPPVFAHATQNLLEAMRAEGVQRYLALAGMAVHVPGDRPRAGDRLRARALQLLFRSVLSDRQAEVELLRRSTIRWTLVRVPLVVERAAAGVVRIDALRCPGRRIAVDALAQLLVEQVDDPTWAGRAPFAARGPPP